MMLMISHDDLDGDNTDKEWKYCGSDYEEHQQMWLVIITVGARASKDPD